MPLRWMIVPRWRPDVSVSLTFCRPFSPRYPTSSSKTMTIHSYDMVCFHQSSLLYVIIIPVNSFFPCRWHEGYQHERNCSFNLVWRLSAGVFLFLIMQKPLEARTALVSGQDWNWTGKFWEWKRWRDYPRLWLFRTSTLSSKLHSQQALLSPWPQTDHWTS